VTDTLETFFVKTECFINFNKLVSCPNILVSYLEGNDRDSDQNMLVTA